MRNVSQIFSARQQVTWSVRGLALFLALIVLLGIIVNLLR